jgi:aspartyl-tRNA(Asn)/glutamyl-tRNA(Gln) amidotransferase subunit A
MNELLDLTVAEAASRIASRQLSREEYRDAWREAAAADELNAYLWRSEEMDTGGEGPLAGIPVAVKDIFCTEGVPTTAASRILEGYRPPYTASAVRRLGEAGASVLGKTNMDEFAMGSSNENSAYGPVLNPRDRERVPPSRSGPIPAARSASRRRSAASSA